MRACRRRARVSLLCSEEERESIPIWNTQDVPLTLATLNTRKRKKSFIVLLLGEKETKDAKKESPPEKHPTLFVYRDGGLFFCPSSLCSSSYVVVV